jgi:hypothetical protein
VVKFTTSHPPRTRKLLTTTLRDAYGEPLTSVSDCIADRVRLAVSQPTERQCVRDQIKAALIFARADFVNVFNLFHAFAAKGN